jgi:hypothetical protein
MIAGTRVILTAGQRIVTLPFSYMPATNALFVSLNGKMLSLDLEYLEIGVDQVALVAPAEAGEILEVRNIEEGAH